MPLEIREVVIKARLEREKSTTTPAELNTTDLNKLKNKVLAECLELVEEVLRKRFER